MKLIEILDGLSVNLDRITLVTRLSDTETQVVVDGEAYVTNIPYKTFKKLLSRQLAKEPLSAVEQLARFQTRPTP